MDASGTSAMPIDGPKCDFEDLISMSDSGEGVEFFFDILDDGVLMPNSYGVELASWDEAREEAKIVVCELIRDQKTAIDERVIHVDVRTSKTGPLYRARIAFEAGWLDPGPA